MQRGSLYTASHAWWLRYREWDGERYVRLTHRIGTLNEFPTKTLARQAADAYMQKVNALHGAPVSSRTTLGNFWDEHYLPYIQQARQPSTVHGYRKVWRRYLEPRIADMQLLEFQTYHGEKLMRIIDEEYDLSHKTLLQIRAVLASFFKQAKRLGAIATHPIRDVEVPKGKHETAETYAYSLAEILRLIEILPEPASTIVAVAAFSGLRRSEIRGLRWSDYDGNALRVTRKFWQKEEGELKTKASRGVVPVIPLLRDKLTAWKKLAPRNVDILFPSSTKTPLDLNNVLTRQIKPILLKRTDVAWHGWHAFRRGLATNLKKLSVDDKIIQGILRHSQITTTQNIYMKDRQLAPEHAAAMQKLEDATRRIN